MIKFLWVDVSEFGVGLITTITNSPYKTRTVIPGITKFYHSYN